MPGSIKVSVLDIKELPSSSASVKVSLGNVEYEAEEKGTFLFPLRNLRDNLNITVQDIEGNQVSHSGVRTMAIIEKGTWDDVFPIEGGGFVHMKLQFILSDEERNRIRSMRESAMKKKQAEILGSRLKNTEIVKSLASSLHRHENAADRSMETLFSRESEQKPNSLGNLVEEYKQNLQEKILSDVKVTSEQSTSTPLLQETKADLNTNNEIPLKPAEESKYLVKLKPVDNPVEKLDKQNLEEKIPIYVKQVSKLPPFSQETEVNTINNNEIQLQQPDLPKRVQHTSSRDVGSTGIAEKIKLFPPKLAGEPDKQGSADKSTRNIKKMISVFESSSQDTVPLKPSSTKSYRVGTLRSLKDSNFKDYYEKLESSQERLKSSETSSSTRLRNSFSTGDLRKDLSSLIKEGDGVGVDDNFVESSEIILQSEGVNNEKKFALTETKTNEQPTSLKGDATVSRRVLSDNKESHTGDAEKESIDGRKFEEKVHQEKSVASIPEGVVKGEVQCESDVIVKEAEEMENSESAYVKASNGSLGQAVKIALVVGFGVLVLLFRQREPGKGKKNENKHALRNQAFMNKRGSIEEQHRRIGVSRFT